MKKILLIVLTAIFLTSCTGRQISDSEFRANMKMINDQIHKNADRQQRVYETQMNSIKKNQPTSTECTPNYGGGMSCTTR